MKNYDLVIVGGGPAGLAAAVSARPRGSDRRFFTIRSSTPPIPGRSSWRRKITLPERLWSPDSRMQAEAEEEEALSPRREPAFL